MSVSFEDVTYIYNKDTPVEKTAIKGVSVSIGSGEFVAVTGKPGSGKSTFLQLLGGLLKPTSGFITASSTVGVVFQFPEKQFFEETVYKDISFPLIQAGIPGGDIEERVRRAFHSVDIDLQAYRDRSPLELSTGEMRRIAIASILVLDTELIALDNPLAGLDHRGKREILNELKRLQKDTGKSFIIATQELEAVSRVCDRFLILENGALAGDGGYDLIEKNMSWTSQIQSLAAMLREKGVDLGDGIRDEEEIFRRIKKISASPHDHL